MKTASELYEISKTQAPKIVAGILEGVREHIIQRCEQEANKGATYYSIYLKRGYAFVKDLLLQECIKLVKEFENNNYKVTIEDDGNDYYVNFILTFSWNSYPAPINESFGHAELLYVTDRNI